MAVRRLCDGNGGEGELPEAETDRPLLVSLGRVLGALRGVLGLLGLEAVVALRIQPRLRPEGGVKDRDLCNSCVSWKSEVNVRSCVCVNDMSCFYGRGRHGGSVAVYCLARSASVIIFEEGFRTSP